MHRLALPIILTAVLTGCPEDRLVRTLPPDVFVDTYAQQSAAKVDVLWVVDNSESMTEEQDNLGKNFAAFIDLFTRGSIDYRIGVTTTDVFKDAGQLRGTPKILTPQTPDVPGAFARNIRVGISGSANERGLQAANLALERQRKTNQPKLDQIESCKLACTGAACIQECVNKFPVEFVRPDAYLYLIFVSDEQDRSEEDVRYYWRSYETANGIGNDGTVNVAAIVGPEDNDCSATYGSRYIELTKLTGGEVGSICDPSFASTLRKLASNAIGLRRKFALTKRPNLSTLEVILRYPCNTASDVIATCASSDASACEGAAPDAMELLCTPKQGGADGWTYEAETNVVFFAGESVPGLKAELDIQYYEEGKGP